VRADDALISWAAKQKLYFGDLLSPQAAAAVAALLEGRQPAAADAAPGAAAATREARGAGVGGVGVGVLPLAERKGLVEMLRQLSSVVQPDRYVCMHVQVLQQQSARAAHASCVCCDEHWMASPCRMDSAVHLHVVGCVRYAMVSSATWPQTLLVLLPAVSLTPTARSRCLTPHTSRSTAWSSRRLLP
jgi:hypothetical protein